MLLYTETSSALQRQKKPEKSPGFYIVYLKLVIDFQNFIWVITKKMVFLNDFANSLW
jgi:hypothetical protein